MVVNQQSVYHRLRLCKLGSLHLDRLKPATLSRCISGFIKPEGSGTGSDGGCIITVTVAVLVIVLVIVVLVVVPVLVMVVVVVSTSDTTLALSISTVTATSISGRRCLGGHWDLKLCYSTYGRPPFFQTKVLASRRLAYHTQ